MIKNDYWLYLGFDQIFQGGENWLLKGSLFYA